MNHYELPESHDESKIFPNVYRPALSYNFDKILKHSFLIVLAILD